MWDRGALRGHLLSLLSIRSTRRSLWTAPAHAFVDQLLDVEHQGRDARPVRSALRLPSLFYGSTLANFAFAFQFAVERSRIDTPATCARIRAADTVPTQRPARGRQDPTRRRRQGA